MPLDAARLSECFSRDAERLLVFFTRRTYDAALATDLVGETFARAFEDRGRFRGQSDDELSAWVYGIARNTLREALRRGRNERRALARLGLPRAELTDPEIARIEELADLGGLRGSLSVALDDLGAEVREAVRLRVVEELGYPAVARRLGISEPAARARVSRGLRALATALDPLEGKT